MDVRPPEVAETATKPSPAPLQNDSLGGCTVDMSPLNYRLRRGHIVSVRDALFTARLLLYYYCRSFDH